RRDRADLKLHSAHGCTEDLHYREAIRAEHGAHAADQRTQARTQQERCAACRDVDDATGDGARRSAGHRELLRRQPEDDKAALGEQILAQLVDRLLLRFEPAVVTQLLYDTPAPATIGLNNSTSFCSVRRRNAQRRTRA